MWQHVRIHRLDLLHFSKLRQLFFHHLNENKKNKNYRPPLAPPPPNEPPPKPPKPPLNVPLPPPHEVLDP